MLSCYKFDTQNSDSDLADDDQNRPATGSRGECNSGHPRPKPEHQKVHELPLSIPTLSPHRR